MKLEHLRSDDIGDLAAFVFVDGSLPKIKPLLTFQEYCSNAFYLTCQSIEQLEKSDSVISPGNTTILATGMWFISIEAFINFLLKIACCAKNSSFDDLKKKDVGTRLNALLSVLNIPTEDFYRSGIFQRLGEFKAFRNELFHDRSWDSGLDFHVTAFCKNPNSANQVDAIQGAIISLEIFHAFRSVYRGLDLMPCIKVSKADSFGWKKYDELFNGVIIPYFERVLKKHGLTTDLPLAPALINLNPSEILKEGHVGIAIKGLQDEQFKHPPNKLKTSIGEELMELVRQTITIKPDTFSLPQYLVQSESTK